MSARFAPRTPPFAHFPLRLRTPLVRSTAFKRSVPIFPLRVRSPAFRPSENPPVPLESESIPQLCLKAVLPTEVFGSEHNPTQPGHERPWALPAGTESICAKKRPQVSRTIDFQHYPLSKFQRFRVSKFPLLVFHLSPQPIQGPDKRSRPAGFITQIRQAATLTG